jgi:ParB family transcriptional regulator, chromosome partitioning protein
MASAVPEEDIMKRDERIKPTTAGGPEHLADCVDHPKNDPGRRLEWIERAKIDVPDEYARTRVSPEGIDALVQSIAHDGPIEPIAVRQVGECYELVSGLRRLEAHRILEMDPIQALVGEYEEPEVASLVANVAREDLDPVAVALAFRRLVEVYGMSHEEIAQRVARERSWVVKSIRILSLPDPVLAEVPSAFTNNPRMRSALVEMITLDSDEKKLEAWKGVKAGKIGVEGIRRMKQTPKKRNRKKPKVRIRKWEPHLFQEAQLALAAWVDEASPDQRDDMQADLDSMMSFLDELTAHNRKQMEHCANSHSDESEHPGRCPSSDLGQGQGQGQGLTTPPSSRVGLEQLPSVASAPESPATVHPKADGGLSGDQMTQTTRASGAFANTDSRMSVHSPSSRPTPRRPPDWRQLRKRKRRMDQPTADQLPS